MTTPPSTTTLEDYQLARERVFRAAAVLATVLTVGAAGYWYIGWLHAPGRWSWNDCVYMTAITVTTVGFGEVIDVAAVPFGRAWTLVLLIFGIAGDVYVISSITSFFVEGDFTHFRRYRRQERRMREIHDHHIVCGCGTTGIHVVRELRTIGEKVVVIDRDKDKLTEASSSGAELLHGDATDDDVLERAGISRAKGIVAALDDDKTNMFVVVSARQRSPTLRIVAKAVAPSAAPKLQRAGANAVVSTAFIGGLRMASELVRPHVVRFLDEMVNASGTPLRIEEATVEKGSALVGRRLDHESLRALVIAVREQNGTVNHAPRGTFEVHPGETLIAIGTPSEIAELRALAQPLTEPTTR